MKIIKIVLISIFVLSILIFIDSKINVVNTGGSAYPPNWNVERRLKLSYSEINSLLNIFKQSPNGINYNGRIELANQIKRYSDIDYLRFYAKNLPEHSTPFSKFELFRYKMFDYKNCPVLSSSQRNISYIFYRIENNCSIVDVDNYENSSCIIIVDTNGYKDKPNSIKYKPKNSIATDRYPFIIDGNTNSVVIPKYFEDLIKND